MRVAFQEVALSSLTAPGTVNTLGASGDVSALDTAFSGTTFGTAERCVTFDGTIQGTTAGTIGLFAATPSSSDTYSVRGYGSYWEITPIGT
jgi:hypothetical protein